MESAIRDFALGNSMTPDNPELVTLLRKAKGYGFSDRQLAEMWKRPEGDVAALRRATGHRAHLLSGGHLRSRIPGLHPLFLFHL